MFLIDTVRHRSPTCSQQTRDVTCSRLWSGLSKRRRQWANIKPPLGRRLLLDA